MVKSTSLWAGSDFQVEVCARARGAASARMPVTRVKRFMDGFSFLLLGRWPLRRLAERGALGDCAVVAATREAARTESCVRMRRDSAGIRCNKYCAGC